jgi:hypothetical protein
VTEDSTHANRIGLLYTSTLESELKALVEKNHAEGKCTTMNCAKAIRGIEVDEEANQDKEDKTKQRRKR